MKITYFPVGTLFAFNIVFILPVVYANKVIVNRIKQNNSMTTRKIYLKDKNLRWLKNFLVNGLNPGVSVVRIV